MAVIIHLMGPTCAGKSTIIDTMKSIGGSMVFPVQIGKALRAKYGEAYFKGQAAPESTQNEALQLYYDLTKEGISNGAKVILVDGQPRDLGQSREMMKRWPGHDSLFYLVTASHEEREVRAKAGREPGPNLDLALARLDNDYKNCYVVMAELLKNRHHIEIVDTSDPTFDVGIFSRDLLNILLKL